MPRAAFAMGEPSAPPIRKGLASRAGSLCLEVLWFPALAIFAPSPLLLQTEVGDGGVLGGGSTLLSLATRMPRRMRETPGAGVPVLASDRLSLPIIRCNTDRLLFAADDPAGVIDGDIVGIYRSSRQTPCSR